VGYGGDDAMTAHQQHPNEGPTDGNFGSGNDVIELASTEEVQGEQIVTVWFCSFKSKLMTIKFNGRYQNKLPDSIPKKFACTCFTYREAGLFP
jgi:hypothetical protein